MVCSSPHPLITRVNPAHLPIVGTGRGPASTRGRQVYELAKLILTAQYIPIIGAGKARWNHIHVANLSDVYVRLVEAAVSKRTDPELWGAKGYYFTESGEHVWGELAESIGRQAAKMGFIKEEPQKQALDREKAIEQAGFEAESWGLNSRGKAERAAEVLGWKPSAPSLLDEIPAILKSEHARLNKGV